MKLRTASSPINFLQDLGKLDPLVFMTAADVASVIAAPSVQAVYAAIQRNDLPAPLIRRNRLLRWTVGQIREHLQKLQADFQAESARQADGHGYAGHAHTVLGGKKRGRPRASVGGRAV